MMMKLEWLPHDLVEDIMERLPVRSLLRFKCVSKQWKATIESRSFQERQLKHRREGGDPDVLMVSARADESLRTHVLGTSTSVKIPTPWDKEEETIEYIVSINSCDGLVCLYQLIESAYVVNPATRWYHPLPLSQFQQLVISLGRSYFMPEDKEFFKLGFGKDILSSTTCYKPVWLYNSSEVGLDNATTCEVFDFSANAWRYVAPSSPYRIVGAADPVFVHGSLHWFTDCEETKILSFDLHTETFQVISKAPFANSHDNRYAIVLCNLDNRLCVSHKKVSEQVIWSFNSGNKTWDKLYSIDLVMTSTFYGCPTLSALHPLALLDGKKKKLLFYDRLGSQYLLVHDPEDDFHADFTFLAEESVGIVVSYFQSLISIC